MDRGQEDRVNPGEMTSPRLFPIVGMLFVSFLLISNTIAVKIITVWGFVLPAGIICFPVTYIFGDVLTECYGFRRSRMVIWTGFLCLMLMSVFYWGSTFLTPAPFWDGQEAYSRFFSLSPRIALASFIAYLVGEFSNSVVLSRMKIWSHGKNLWLRTIGSTIVGEGFDSVIFNFAAFLGVFGLRDVAYIALSGYVLKVAYEIVATPLTYGVVAFLKRKEGVDHYDHGIRYNPIGLD
jgi:queuosine precursor transporter